MGQGNACFHFAPLALFRLRLHLAHVESAHNNAHTRDQTQPTAYYDMDNETLLYNFLKSQHYYEQAQATVLAIDCREMCVFIRSCMVLTHGYRLFCAAGDFPARKERLIREIMAVDDVSLRKCIYIPTCTIELIM